MGLYCHIAGKNSGYMYWWSEQFRNQGQNCLLTKFVTIEPITENNLWYNTWYICWGKNAKSCCLTPGSPAKCSWLKFFSSWLACFSQTMSLSNNMFQKKTLNIIIRSCLPVCFRRSLLHLIRTEACISINLEWTLSTQ